MSRIKVAVMTIAGFALQCYSHELIIWRYRLSRRKKRARIAEMNEIEEARARRFLWQQEQDRG